ncbi:MAG: peptidylprolyl isomerase [Porphyromonas sp.]|nr:peptidylprolyl isomerase [Porphyromonas sp.]
MKVTLFTILLALLPYTSLLAQEPETYVKFDTNKGSFTVKLYNETPIHRDNFIKLVETHAYDDLLFHRIIKGFMCQAGGDIRDKDEHQKKYFKQKYDYTLPAEILYPLYYHKRGALAAARIGDEHNPERESSGIQFYIVTGEYFLDSDLRKYDTPERGTMPSEVREAYKTEGGAPHLDGAYTVFGEVVSGMKTIQKIESVPTDPEDRPVKDVYIRSAEIVKKP